MPLEEKVPAGQLVQYDKPDTSEKVPGVHIVHTAELLAPDMAEYLPNGQLIQLDEPKVVEKVPGLHG